MKLLIPLIVFTALSTNAHAHSGSQRLFCKSAKNSGSKQKLEIFLKRGNAAGMYAPTIKVHVDNKQFVLTTPEDNTNYGSTFHNSPLKVITVTAEVPYAGEGNTGHFTIVAIPETVHAFDFQNEPAPKWSIEDQKEGCFDVGGSAKFQGYIEGYLFNDKNHVEVETQILDCTLSYDPGMSC
jgi:hypothetical protein